MWAQAGRTLGRLNMWRLPCSWHHLQVMSEKAALSKDPLCRLVSNGAASAQLASSLGETSCTHNSPDSISFAALAQFARLALAGLPRGGGNGDDIRMGGQTSGV